MLFITQHEPPYQMHMESSVIKVMLHKAFTVFIHVFLLINYPTKLTVALGRPVIATIYHR